MIDMFDKGHSFLTISNFEINRIQHTKVYPPIDSFDCEIDRRPRIDDLNVGGRNGTDKHRK